MAKLVTVFGASGFIGRQVVRSLTARGWRVRGAVRRPHLAQGALVPGQPGQVQLVQANVRNEASVEDALAGADAAVNLVGILAEAGRNSFDAVQRDGARNVAEAAARLGIADLVQVSAIGADERSDSDYAKTKGAGERLSREAFPDAVVLRPSIVFGPDDDFFNRFATMARLSPALPLIGGGRTLFQPVFVGDVAEAVAVAIADPACRGRTYELGGPEVASFKALMELMLKVIGRWRLLVPVPFLAAGAMGRGGDLAGRLPFVAAPITADQVRLLRRDNVVRGEGAALTLAELGIQPRTLDAILPTYLYRFRKHGQYSPEVPV